MDIEHFCVKFFARPGKNIDDSIFIRIFNEWIRFQRLEGILLDVADYRHVPQGPGIMLITHEINFAMDYSGGRFGLLAQRKLGSGLTHQERLLELVQATAAFGAQLESDLRVAGKLRLEAGVFYYIANDRLTAPNTEAAFAELLPDLEAAAAIIYPGQKVTVKRIENDPRTRLTAIIRAGVLDMKTLAKSISLAV